MTWDAYAEALAALSSVDAKAERAVERHRRRLAEDLRGIEEEERRQSAAARTRAARLDALRERLGADPDLNDVESSRVGTAVAIRRELDSATGEELEQWIQLLEREAGEAAAAAASLRRSLHRVRVRPQPHPDTPLPARPTRRGAAIVVVLGVLLLVVLGAAALAVGMW